MKNQIPTILSLVLVSFLLSRAASAGSATWNLNPGSGDWNTATNWTPAAVPNGTNDVATFAASNTTAITVSLQTTVNGITFNPGASPFTITTGQILFTISGAGMTNNSGITQNVVVGNQSALYLTGSVTAGSGMVYTNTGSQFSSQQGFVVFLGTSTASDSTYINESGLASGGGGGYMQFADMSTAGNGTFINEGTGANGAGGGYIEFGGVTQPGSNAGNANFTLNGARAPSGFGGQVNFYCYTSAANGTFTINGARGSGARPGIMYFACDANADNATFIANGGTNGGAGGSINFTYQARGGTARVIMSDNSTLDISMHDAPGMSIGSIEGTGTVFLGANSLSVGTNNLDTSFSGSFQDGGINGGAGGSLTKIGTGSLVLARSSDNTGDTHVTSGALLVKNGQGSATGTGSVFVDGGKLGGSGNIAGALTVGTSSGQATLRLGQSGSPLSIGGSLTFGLDGRCQFVLNSDASLAGSVAAHGVSIRRSVPLLLQDRGTAILPVGFSFTVISNTATDPIAGTFRNLADGATIVVGNNTYQADYGGGDGNDLTLTVVP